jgi:hypothetical protein
MTRLLLATWKEIYKHVLHGVPVSVLTREGSCYGGCLLSSLPVLLSRLECIHRLKFLWIDIILAPT